MNFKKCLFLNFLVFTVLSCCSLNNVFAKDVEKEHLGTSIFIGQYEQDGNIDNGQEPIEWTIIDENDNELIVISKYIIEKISFNDGYTANSTDWANSSLRKWLNDSFINNAFTKEEIEKIHVSSVTDKKADNKIGDVSKDKIYILSYEEAWEYFSTSGERCAKPTKYAEKRGLYVDKKNSNSSWWLINSYSNDLYKYVVNPKGNHENSPRVNEDSGLRPVMKVDKSVLSQ